MRFVDLNTQSFYSTGVDTPLRMTHHAKRMGLEIGICDGVVHEDIPSGTLIRPQGVRDMKKALAKVKTDYVIVEGGKDLVNRAAVKDPNVSILSGWWDGGRDGGIDQVVARWAAESGVAIEVNLKAIISAKRGKRVRLLGNIGRLLKLYRKYHFPIIATSGARCYNDLRGPDVGLEILRCAGFTEEEALAAMETVPLMILEGEK